MPAGIEIRLRKIGRNLPKSTVFQPCLANHAVVLSMSLARTSGIFAAMRESRSCPSIRPSV